MTIYYVNPVSGSNSNSGLSWALAWKYPPGNGTAINPGDEIRFAKSPERAPGYSFNINASQGTITTDMTGATLGYQIFSPSYSKVGNVAGSYVANATQLRVLFPVSTSVPANTKMAYYVVSRTQTTLNNAEFWVEMVGIPEGDINQYLKVVYCSDALGNTPILTLTGGTRKGSTTSTYAARVVFSYSSASTLNLTIGSIAIYSVAAFTTDAVISSVGYYNFPSFSVAQTDPKYFPQGCVFKGDGVATTQPVISMRPFYYTFYAPQTISSTWSLWAYWKRTQTYTSTTTTGILMVYDPMPFGLSTLYEVPLTFSGTQASPIKISGGWNTATSTQDGMTNLAIGTVYQSNRKGAFIFSSGGQWIEYDHFICMHTHLMFYNYTVGTINSVKLTDCVWGSSLGSVSYGAHVAGFEPNGNTTVTISKVYFLRCCGDGLLPFTRYVPWDGANTGTNASAFTNDQLTIGDADIIDCHLTYGLYAYNGATCANFTGYFKVYSSVANELRSFLTFTGTGYFRPLGTSRLEFTDVIFGVQGWIMQSYPVNAATTSKITLTRCCLSENGDSTSNPGVVLYVNGFSDVIVDGITYRHRYQYAVANRALFLNYTASWWTANPAGPAITLTGAHGTDEAEAYSSGSGITIAYPPSLITTSGMTLENTRYAQNQLPGLTFTNMTKPLTLTDFVGSFVKADTPSSIPAATYWPSANLPKLILNNCTCRPSTLGMPLGSFRMIGGRIPASGEAGFKQYVAGSVVTLNEGLALFGVTLSDVRSGHSAAGYVNVNNHQRTIATGIHGTDIGMAYYSTSYPTLIDFEINCDATSTLSVAGISLSESQGYGGVTVRKPNGDFFFKSGNTLIYPQSMTPNEYGKIPLRIFGLVRLASLGVMAGSLVTLSTRVLPDATGGWFYFMILPGDAFYSTINAHMVRRKYLSTVDDLVVSMSIAPTSDGIVRLVIGSTSQATLKDFTAVVA